MSEVQGTIFDAIAAREAADAGIARAAKNNSMVLDLAKKKAVELGRKQTFVTADDVQAALVDVGLSEHHLGNAAGAVFRNKKLWHYTGETVQSTRVSRHGALIRKWKYIGN
jgi:hypothetical protein